MAMTRHRQVAPKSLESHEAANVPFSKRLVEQLDELLARESELNEKLFWSETIVNNIPANLYLKDVQGRFMLGNRGTLKQLGLETNDMLAGKTDFDFHAPELARELSTLETEVLSEGKPLIGIEHEIIDAGGRKRWMLTSKVPICDANDLPAGLVGFSYDITDRKEAESFMLAQANMFGMVARSVPLEEIVSSIILLVEDQIPGAIGSVQMLSPDRGYLSEPVAPRLPRAMKTLLADRRISNEGHGSAAVLYGETVIVEDVSVDPLWAALAATAATVGIRSSWTAPISSYQGEVLGTFSLYVSESSVPTGSQSDVIAMASYMLGIAVERKQSEERIKFLAHHDALTGLPNRSMFDERLTSVLELAREKGGRVKLAFLDLDNFKLINDSLGHEAGDQLLKAVAERASCCLGKSDVIARLGGDEFVALLTDLPPGQEMDQDNDKLHALRAVISEPITLSGRSLQITFSMGVACFPDHGETSKALLANADLAMYRAKESGRNNTQTFSPEMAEVSNAKLLLHQQLCDAIAGHQFVLHYQPLIDLNTGRSFAVEALVRWNHPDRGLVSPADFIPLAEETGLIVPIGDWVLKSACLQNRAWQDAGIAPVVVSVNVSARQFGENDWAGRVAAILRETGLQAQYLELELTESLIMKDLPRAKATMNELDLLGVRLAIDDFGTGYSNLSALKSFHVDRLKIDRSFVQNIPADEEDMAIVAAIISLAHKLGLQVIAEGVETRAQVDFLRQSGCNEVQGYFFSRPIAPQQCALLLAEPEWPIINKLGTGVGVTSL